MKMTIFCGDDDMSPTVSYSANGELKEIPSGHDDRFALAMFDLRYNERTVMFQDALRKGDKCVVEDNDSRVEGTYLMQSQIDRNPIIVVDMWLWHTLTENE